MAQDDVSVVRAACRYSLTELADLARPGLEAASVERAVVFGTFARGTADGYSDLDLVVVLETDLPFSERWKLVRAVLDSLPVPVDLLVYTPAEFERGVRQGIGIFDAILREGVTIHARS